MLFRSPHSLSYCMNRYYWRTPLTLCDYLLDLLQLLSKPKQLALYLSRYQAQWTIKVIAIQKFNYRMRAIISRGLNTFVPHYLAVQFILQTIYGLNKEI